MPEPAIKSAKVCRILLDKFACGEYGVIGKQVTVEFSSASVRSCAASHLLTEIRSSSPISNLEEDLEVFDVDLSLIGIVRKVEVETS